MNECCEGLKKALDKLDKFLDTLEQEENQSINADNSC